MICCPMSFLAFLPGYERQVCFSFSAVSSTQIVECMERFWHLVYATCEQMVEALLAWPGYVPGRALARFSGICYTVLQNSEKRLCYFLLVSAIYLCF